MPEEQPSEIGRFGFGIKLLRHADGRIEYETQSVNDGILIEMVIMQMKAFLNGLQKDYFDNFDKGSSKFKAE